MGAYRNRPDRRKAPQNIPPALSGAIMSITAGEFSGANLEINFSQPLVGFDPGDAHLLNSIRIWNPNHDYTGTAITIVQNSDTNITVTFGDAADASDICAVWIDDTFSLLRGADSGASCTGNPIFPEAI